MNIKTVLQFTFILVVIISFGVGEAHANPKPTKPKPLIIVTKNVTADYEVNNCKGVVGTEVRSIGKLFTGRSVRVGQATKHFGKPNLVLKKSRNQTLFWRGNRAMKLDFVSFGGIFPYLQEGVFAGSRWRTLTGVQVGNTFSKLKEKHPKAYRNQHRKGSWVLGDYCSPYGEGGMTARISADIRNKKVKAFHIWFGGAGD